VLERGHFEVCGEAENGQQALSKVVELRPDVVVLDLLMPEMNGIEAAARIRKLAPSTKIVLISGCLPPQFGSEAVRLTGAQAYVEKWVAVRDLVPAIRAVLQDNNVCTVLYRTPEPCGQDPSRTPTCRSRSHSSGNGRGLALIRCGCSEGHG
jgi:DNA-binding NarL/FixJ family response regulator